MRRAHLLRAKLLDTISESTIEQVASSLAEMAVGGNLSAIKLLLEYAAGRPAQAREVVVPDREPPGLSLEQLQAVLLGALSPHPQAKIDLAASLDAMARDQTARRTRENGRCHPPDGGPRP